MTALYIFFCVVLNSFAQILLKLGSTVKPSQTVSNLLHSDLSVFLNLYSFAGVLLYGSSIVIWMKVLSLIPLSAAVSFTGLNIIGGMFLSYLLLHESIPPARIIGGAIIVMGVFWVARSY